MAPLGGLSSASAATNYNNYKTVKCKYFDDPARCKFGKNCTFAHSADELRQIFEELPPAAT